VVDLPYPVTIAPGAFEQLPHVVKAVAAQNRVAIITDANVRRSYGARAAKLLALPDSMVLEVAAGEQQKTRETWRDLTDELLERELGRDTTIVALGGGVIGDLAGFVAATYMRGVPYVQVPTTLVAMVDASIGGKTGVDTRHGKNLVGAFHRPAAVLIDPLVLQTLPAEHARAGFAEIIKHGVIADTAYFEQISARAAELTDIIRRSVEIKAAIVSRDEREGGLRKVLNYGHTIGHAIEAATRFEMLHGEAVAIGLVAEARVAERLGVAAKGIAKVIESVCNRAGLPTKMPSIPVDTLIGHTRTDKKARLGRVEYSLPKRIGEMAGADRGWTVPVEDTVVREALA
jgi:3-dehydroquinate synthase